MISDDFVLYLGQALNASITSIAPLSGGDINDVFLLTSEKDRYVVKVNDARRFPGMFEAEKKGLELLRNTNTFTIPEPISLGTFQSHSFLLLSYIESGNRSTSFWEQFGRQLAQLHQHSDATFGLDHDNYIGSLPQQNQRHESISSFYVAERLLPQVTMAADKGFSFANTDAFFKNLEHLIPEEKPALTHGDLWSGNFMVSEDGLPCLIDPAVVYMHRESDLGMMHLFGGFSAILFDSYAECFPLEKNWKERLDLWQLYYLLVHVNLFGGSYYPSANSIIQKYS